MSEWKPLKTGETLAVSDSTLVMAGDVKQPGSLWIVDKGEDEDGKEQLDVAMAILPPGVRLCREAISASDTRGIVFEMPDHWDSRRLLIGGETINLGFDELNLRVEFTPTYKDGRWTVTVKHGPIRQFTGQAPDDLDQPR